MLNDGDFIISHDESTHEYNLNRILFLGNDQSVIALTTSFIATDNSTKYYVEIPETVETNILNVVTLPAKDISYLKSSNEIRVKHPLEFYWEKYQLSIKVDIADPLFISPSNICSNLLNTKKKELKLCQNSSSLHQSIEIPEKVELKYSPLPYNSDVAISIDKRKLCDSRENDSLKKSRLIKKKLIKKEQIATPAITSSSNEINIDIPSDFFKNYKENRFVLFKCPQNPVKLKLGRLVYAEGNGINGFVKVYEKLSEMSDVMICNDENDMVLIQFEDSILLENNEIFYHRLLKGYRLTKKMTDLWKDHYSKLVNAINRSNEYKGNTASKLTWKKKNFKPATLEEEILNDENLLITPLQCGFLKHNLTRQSNIYDFSLSGLNTSSNTNTNNQIFKNQSQLFCNSTKSNSKMVNVNYEQKNTTSSSLSKLSTATVKIENNNNYNNNILGSEVKSEVMNITCLDSNLDHMMSHDETTQESVGLSLCGDVNSQHFHETCSDTVIEDFLHTECNNNSRDCNYTDKNYNSSHFTCSATNLSIESKNFEEDTIDCENDNRRPTFVASSQIQPMNRTTSPTSNINKNENNVQTNISSANSRDTEASVEEVIIPYIGVKIVRLAKIQYCAVINSKGREMRVSGLFDTAIEAAKAYDDAIIKETDQYAITNFCWKNRPFDSLNKIQETEKTLVINKNSLLNTLIHTSMDFSHNCYHLKSNQNEICESNVADVLEDIKSHNTDNETLKTRPTVIQGMQSHDSQKFKQSTAARMYDQWWFEKWLNNC